MSGFPDLNPDLKEKDILAAYREVYQSDAGKIVFADLMERFGTDQSIYDPNPTTLAHNSGLQEAGIVIRSRVREALNAGLEGEEEKKLQQEADDDGGKQ